MRTRAWQAALCAASLLLGGGGASAAKPRRRPLKRSAALRQLRQASRVSPQAVPPLTSRPAQVGAAPAQADPDAPLAPERLVEEIQRQEERIEKLEALRASAAQALRRYGAEADPRLSDPLRPLLRQAGRESRELGRVWDGGKETAIDRLHLLFQDSLDLASRLFQERGVSFTEPPSLELRAFALELYAFLMSERGICKTPRPRAQEEAGETEAADPDSAAGDAQALAVAARSPQELPPMKAAGFGFVDQSPELRRIWAEETEKIAKSYGLEPDAGWERIEQARWGVALDLGSGAAQEQIGAFLTPDNLRKVKAVMGWIGSISWGSAFLQRERIGLALNLGWEARWPEIFAALARLP